MKCTICRKDAENPRLVIGWACNDCVPRGTKAPFTVRSVESQEDRHYVLQFLDSLFGETRFMEFGKLYDVEEMEQLVASTEDNQRIGLAVYTIEADDPSLMTLLTINTDTSFFRHGVASALLEQVKKTALQKGVSTIRVPLSNDDLVSYVFYHKRGFRLSGIDIGLCAKIHGDEHEGLWKLPLRDELYLCCQLRETRNAAGARIQENIRKGKS